MSFTGLNRFVVVASLALATSWPSTVLAAKAETAAAVVAKLYKNFAWEAIGGQPDLFGDDLSHQSRRVLERYFAPTLAALLVQDVACQIRAQGICNLDFDILFDSQDPRVIDLEVQALAPEKVSVEFTDPVSQAKTRLEFRVARIAGQWKITDIIYGRTGTSLRKTLSRRMP